MFASCGDYGIAQEYVNADSAVSTRILVDADSMRYAEVTVLAFDGYPEMTVYYEFQEYNMDRLYKLDAELIVNGKVIKPELDIVEAWYGYGDTYTNINMVRCCDSLTEKLRIAYVPAMDTLTFDLNINKEYPDLDELPDQLSVHLTSESASGKIDTTIALTRRSRKYATGTLRFH